MDNTIVRLDSSNWKKYASAVTGVLEELSKGCLLAFALHKIENLMRHYSVVVPDKYNSIRDSYKLMCAFMLKGYEDTQRQELYNQLMRQLYLFVSDLLLDAKLKFDPSASYLSTRNDNTSLDIGGLKEYLEAFVSDLAMLSLETGQEQSQHAKEIYDKRQKNLSKTFIDILRSGQWSREQANDVADLLLSPTIDSVDAQTICAAIMMAALLSPDPYKVLTLTKVYKNATEQHLKQRALVGWVLSVDGADYSLFPELGDYINSLLEDGNVREEIAELQIQVIYCTGAEQDNETIRKDVMPTILKNQNLEITRYGIKEKEEDPMDDILHSDEMEKRMEDMEKTVQKMVDMQKRGVDIYFGGFSKMKRFGFFYTLCNWFMPFYSQHPGLSHLSKQMMDSGFMKALFATGPFCDSDKYSFALGMSSVYEKLPQNIKEMVGNSGDFNMQVLGDSGADVNNPSYIRRLYLQDLFRFFRINDCRKMFHDPFSTDGGHVFMQNAMFSDSNLLHAEFQRVERFLMKRKQYYQAKNLLDLYIDNNDIEDLLTQARLQTMLFGFNEEVENNYDKVLKLEPDNNGALKGAALTSFHLGKYEKAVNLYKQLSEIYPDKILYKLNIAISLINGNQAEHGVKVVYELYYKYPDDIDVQRALAWGLLCTKRVDQAAKIYNSILSSTSVEAADSLNAGYCAWFKGDIQRAADLFKDFVKAKKSPSDSIGTLMEKFNDDKAILDSYDIPQIDRMIMAGLA